MTKILSFRIMPLGVWRVASLLIVAILISANLFAQKLFDINYNSVSQQQISTLVANESTNLVLATPQKMSGGKVDAVVYQRSNYGVETKFVLINQSNGKNVVFTSKSETNDKLLLSTFLIEELRRSILGDATNYLLVETDENYNFVSAMKVPVSTKTLILPEFYYGHKSNVQVASSENRQIISIFKMTPNYILENPDDTELLNRLERESSYYAYVFQLPDSSLVTYDEIAFNKSNINNEGGFNSGSGNNNYELDSELEYFIVGSGLPFDVTIGTGSNAARINATTYACEIYSAALTGTIPVTTSIDFEPMSPGILGASYSPYTLLISNIYYPTAIANQKVGYRIATYSDITLIFNSDYDWYYGTNGTSGELNDYVTVLLHELTHGLGFYKSFSQTGDYGYGSYPLIFDTYLRSGTSGSFYTAMTTAQRTTANTSNNVYIDATYMKAANGGIPIKIYAPTTWASGSSLSHWDWDVTFTTFMKYAYTSPLHTISTRKSAAMRDLGWVMPAATNFTVSYNTNGGTGTTPTAHTNIASGTSVTLDSGSGLTKSGYVFAGWNTNSSGTGTTYDAGNYTVTSSKTLYAKWATVYTITFNANGGAGTTPSTQTTSSGSQIILPAGTGLTNGTLTFAGWNTNAAGTGTNYYAGDLYTVTSSTTLYAKWNNCNISSFPYSEGFETLSEGTTMPMCWTKTNQTGTVTWRIGTGNAESNPNSAKTGTKNLYFKATSYGTFTQRLTLPSFNFTDKSSATINFWYTNAKWDSDQDVLTVYYRTSSTGNWTLLQTYSNNVTNWTQVNLNLPSVAGAANYEISFVAVANYGYGICIDDVTVNAVSTTTYTVSFNANGGTGTMANQTFTQGVAQALSANTFTRANYIFTGWNTNATGTGTSYTNSQSTTISANITLYAQWTTALPWTGTGTASDPFQIASVEHLKALSTFVMNDPNNDTPGYPTAENKNSYNKYWKLMNDIDMNGVTDFIPIGGWNSTTTSSESKFFAGTFEGNGKRILNLTINKPSNNNVGLFGFVRGTVSNLGTEGGTITGSYYVGGLIGESSSGMVSNCYATGSVSATGLNASVGGLIGVNSGTVNNSYAMASVSATGISDYVGAIGGLIGWSSSGMVSNCYAAPIAITYLAPYFNRGAFIGLLSSGTLTNCYYSNAVIYMGLGSGTSTGLTAKTAAQLKAAAMVATPGSSGNSLNFGQTAPLPWKMDYAPNINQGYPILNWQLPTYTVTFNANGGSGTMSNQMFTQGIAQALPANSFTRTGYIFAGWATSVSGNVVYTNQQSITISANTTLYAKWTPITYTITYNGNNHTSGTAPANQTKTYGINLTLQTNSGNLVRTGYTFSGWNTLADGAGTDYAVGETLSTDLSTTQGATVTLYAKWTPKTAITINETPQSFVYNGSARAFTVIPTPSTVTTGWTITYVPAGNPINAGIYDVIVNRAEDATYAAFSKTINAGLVIEKASVTVTANAQSKVYGEVLPTLDYTTIPANLITGNTFSGALTTPVTQTSDVGTYPINQGTVTIASGNYTITYVGANVTVTPKIITLNVEPISSVTYNGSAHQPTVVVKDGTTTLTLATDYTVSYGNNINAGTATVTITGAGNYAGSTGSQTFTITKATYDMSGVSFNNATYEYDGTPKTILIAGTLPNGVNASHINNTRTDVGSQTAAANFTGDEINYNPIESKTATLTITAPAFTLTLNPNGGTVSPTTISVTYGEEIGILPIPTKDGYEVGSWQIDETTITEETVWSYLEDKTAVAQWTVGVVETRLIASLQVFPNPTHDNVTIVSENQPISEISIFDAKGALLQTINGERLNGERQTVSMQSYPAGTYYFTVILQNKEKQTVKVLKQ